MGQNRLLNLLLDEVDDLAMAMCPEFNIGTFGQTIDNAREHLFENVKITSYILVEKEKRGKEVDKRIISYAKKICNNGASIRDYFQEAHITR
jgi:hypothetical protein